MQLILTMAQVRQCSCNVVLVKDYYKYFSNVLKGWSFLDYLRMAPSCGYD